MSVHLCECGCRCAGVSVRLCECICGSARVSLHTCECACRSAGVSVHCFCEFSLGCAFPTETGSGQTALNRLERQVVQLVQRCPREEADEPRMGLPCATWEAACRVSFSLRCLGGCSHAVCSEPSKCWSVRRGGASRQVAVWQAAGPTSRHASETPGA